MTMPSPIRFRFFPISLKGCVNVAIISVGTDSDGQVFVLDKNYYSNNTGIIIPKKGEALCDTLIL